MEISISDNQRDVVLPSGMEEMLGKLLISVLLLERAGEDTEVSLAFVDDGEIRRLNRIYRGYDEKTDVLSFSLREASPDEPAVLDGEDCLLGDLVISLETARRQAEEYGHSLEREVCFLAVHGILHLLGYDHEAAGEKQRMRKREEEILGSFDLRRA